MYYYMYETKNLLNGKIYVGVHKTKSLDDGYMGSGKVILQAIDKYGKENFSLKILEYFNSEEEMFLREKEYVNEEFLLREDVYNLRRGGFGGFDYINKSGITKFAGKNHKEESKKKMAHFGNKHALGNNGGAEKRKGQKRERKDCEHCGKNVAVNVYARFHGVNCKRGYSSMVEP